MKKNFILTGIVFFALMQGISGQVKDSLMTRLYEKFDSFDYDQVITISDDLLSRKDLIGKDEIIEVYRIRATAQFSVQNEDSAKNSLRQIILIDESYSLDPVKNSPKLISLFDELKHLYLLEKQNKSVQDSIAALQSFKEPEVFYTDKDIIEARSLFRNSITRSLFLPGWGHLYLGRENLKGAILGVSALGTLGGMIYYIMDSNKKEKAYLQESNKALINNKYDEYNTSYKLRNVFITAFSAIWLYTQIDLLYITSNKLRVTGSVGPDASVKNGYQFNLTFNF